MNLRRVHALSGAYLWVDFFRRRALVRAYKAEARKLRALLRQKRQEDAQRKAHEAWLAKMGEAYQSQLANMAQASINQQAYMQGAYQNLGGLGSLNAYANAYGLGSLFR